MSNYRFIQLDVYRSRVHRQSTRSLPEAEGLTDEQMMQIAREMNLSETVFVYA
jgi:predicted PhzF superfamily epimerase YddE/YHI9